MLRSTVPLEITVVDNASSDGSLDPIRGKALTLISNRQNRGFGAACNQAAAGLAPDDLLAFVNPDCVLEPDCLEKMTEAFDLPDPVGLAGAWVLNPDGSVQKATLRKLPTVRRTLNALLDRRAAGLDGGLDGGLAPDAALAPVEAVSGALLMVSVSCFRSLGGYDEGYFLHCEDLDLMRRAGQAGWQLRLCRKARAIHVQGVSHRGAPLRAQAHKHASLSRYFSSRLGPAARLVWSALIWSHFVLRAPLWWLAGGRRG